MNEMNEKPRSLPLEGTKQQRPKKKKKKCAQAWSGFGSPFTRNGCVLVMTGIHLLYLYALSSHLPSHPLSPPIMDEATERGSSGRARAHARTHTHTHTHTPVARCVDVIKY